MLKRRVNNTPVVIESRQVRADETPHFAYQPESLLGEGPAEGEWMRFGDWLVRRGLISSGELFLALHDAFICSCRLGDVLVERGTLDRGSVEQEASSFHSFVAFQRTPEPLATALR
jgi:hypothetical protein